MTASLRMATMADAPILRELMRRAIDQLQQGFLEPEEIRASHAIMGLDTQLIVDGTYYIAQSPEGACIGCGGWSIRTTLFGGDQTEGRLPTLLDPACDMAPFRAMYTHPDHARRGIAGMILAHSESAARQAGFRRGTLASTLAGAAFYRRQGWGCEAPFTARAHGTDIPLIRMEKALPEPGP